MKTHLFLILILFLGNSGFSQHIIELPSANVSKPGEIYLDSRIGYHQPYSTSKHTNRYQSIEFTTGLKLLANFELAGKILKRQAQLGFGTGKSWYGYVDVKMEIPFQQFMENPYSETRWPKIAVGVKHIAKDKYIRSYSDRSKNLSNDISGRIQAISDKLDTLSDSEKIRVFYEVWDAPLMTAGPLSFTGQMLSRAGAINIFSDVKGEYPQVSSEELISRNPQAIISSDTHGEKLSLEAMRSREGWTEIDAFKKNNVILLDGNIVSRPGPRMIDAIEMIAASLYPELF